MCFAVLDFNKIMHCCKNEISHLLGNSWEKKKTKKGLKCESRIGMHLRSSFANFSSVDKRRMSRYDSVVLFFSCCWFSAVEYIEYVCNVSDISTKYSMVRAKPSIPSIQQYCKNICRSILWKCKKPCDILKWCRLLQLDSINFNLSIIFILVERDIDKLNSLTDWKWFDDVVEKNQTKWMKFRISIARGRYECWFFFFFFIKFRWKPFSK